MGASRRKLLPTASHAINTANESIGIYVYCVARANAAPTLTQPEPCLPGASAPLVLPLNTRTWVIATEVPLSIYGAGAIELRMKDLDWVGTCGVAHQAMLDACMRASDAVVPMKVFTIFNSVERACGEMRRHGNQLHSLMRQVAGCVEWGVRITRAPQLEQRLRRQIVRERLAALTRSSGTAFLEAKAQQRAAVREAAETLDQHVQALAKTLHGVTRDVRYRRDPTGGSVPVLFDAAYLVPRRSEERFRAQVRLKSRPLLAQGCRVTVTGPWPAYSFVSPTGR